MIDLAKPLGIHEGLTFYGDHEQKNLVFYFPDEVSLAPQINRTGNPTDLYELYFQLFSEDDVIIGQPDDLRKTAGSILSLGVQCTVSPARVKKALQTLQQTHPQPDDLIASLPLWKDGTVNLMVLDSITNDAATITDDSFVKSIIGSKKPALLSSDLKSIFNVRLDSRGTSLIHSTLTANTGNVAGVLYDLQYTAIRPAVDLRIWANLGRCYDSVSHQLGVKAEFYYGVKFSLGAEFEWVTKKLEEDGDLKIEVLSQADDPETKKMIDELVKDFKDSVLREMFTPYVNPVTTNIAVSENGQVPVVGVAYKFKTEKIGHDKIIDVDFRERSVVTRTHNPQAHLWMLGKQIAANSSAYIQRVKFNDLWKTQNLTIDLVHNFDDEQNDLLRADLIIWRKKDGINIHAAPDAFAIPDGVQPLKNLSFYKTRQQPVSISWLYETEEVPGYYYQIRFIYSGKIKTISSPGEIITPPLFSSSQDLIIFPDTYTFFRKIEIRKGNISFEEFKQADIRLSLQDAAGKSIDAETITLRADNPSAEWTVRGKDKNELFINVVKDFHYLDDRPSIQLAATYLTDDEVIVNKPFSRSALKLIPLLNGNTADIKEVILEISITTPDLADSIKETYRITPSHVPEINIRLHSPNDRITYRSRVITQTNELILLDQGEINTDVLVINLHKMQEKEITFKWEGRSPDALDLSFLQLELRQEGDSDSMEIIEFKGSEIPLPIIRRFPNNMAMQYRIIRRFRNGTVTRAAYTPITDQLIIIKP